MREDELIRRAQAGDREAAAQLCELHWRSVYRLVFARLGNRSEAEDVTQDAFMRLWQHLGRFRGEALGPFVRTIALNLARNRLRDLGRHPLLALDAVPLAAGDAAVDEALLRDEESEALRQALGRLAPDHRRVLELRLVEGRSAAEVAMLTGRTPEAVRALQYRALQRLRAEIARESLLGGA